MPAAELPASLLLLLLANACGDKLKLHFVANSLGLFPATRACSLLGESEGDNAMLAASLSPPLLPPLT
jgi:hypothetical protein